MRDLISRQAAAKELRTYLVDDNFYEDDENVMGFNDGIKCGLDVILDLDAVDMAEWIPCSERLPEIDGCYLVQIGSVSPNIFVARWHVYGGGWWNVKTPVTAWMPLPEPYGGDKGGGTA